MSVLAALVGLVGFVDFLPHTDDGCAVESHCFSCRAHISAITDLVTFASLPLAPSRVTVLEKADNQRPLDAPALLLPPGRAPPVFA